MRFTDNGFDLLRILRLNSQRLARIVTMPLMDGYRRLRRYLNPNGFSTKVIGDIRKSFRKAISAKPSSLKDYVAFPRYYVAKKLLFIIALLIIVLPIVYLKFVHPTVVAKFFTNTMYVNAAEMSGYTGQVKLLSPGNGQVLYEGPLTDGRISGQGKLWDQQGNLVYQGGFLMEMYDGEGELFYPNGQTQYKGSFVKNKFDGTGFHYWENGQLQFEGGYSKGLYEGTGKEYYDNGVLRYSGDFSKNLYQGFGILYDSLGQLVYSGGFKEGKHEGQGVLYENGAILFEGQLAAGKLNGVGKIYSGTHVLYEGSFKDNYFEGTGKAYDAVTGLAIYDGSFAAGKYNGPGKLFDPQSGQLLYEGQFYKGAYEGEGKLYDLSTGFPIYEGGFRLGRFDGQGTEYDPMGGLVQYKGSYILGNYNGPGTLYDTLTGIVLAEGVFQGGNLLMPGLNPTLFPPEDTGSDETGSPGEETDANTEGEPSTNVDQSALFYSGPRNEGGVDYSALRALDALSVQKLFSQDPVGWELGTGRSLVYEDLKEKMGLTIQLDAQDQPLGVDVWNDALVKGVRPGMTQEEITNALGKPSEELNETISESRMVSISQSNRFHNRITNIAVDSPAVVWRYNLSDGTVIQVIFLKGADECVLVEVR